MLVENARVKVGSKIFVTFLGNPGTAWWISEKRDGYFKVALAVSSGSELEFDYLIFGMIENATTDSSISTTDLSSTDSTDAPASVVEATTVPDGGTEVSPPEEVSPPAGGESSSSQTVSAETPISNIEYPISSDETPTTTPETNISGNPPFGSELMAVELLSSVEIPGVETATSTLP